MNFYNYFKDMGNEIAERWMGYGYKESMLPQVS